MPEHLIDMAAAALSLADRPALRSLTRWVHMLGFRGHFVTKSRRYSTNLGTLRAARAAHRARQDQPLADVEADDEDSTVVLCVWQYLGCGYLNPGDALLAAGVEASLRAAREALLDLRCEPPGQRGWRLGSPEAHSRSPDRGDVEPVPTILLA